MSENKRYELSTVFTLAWQFVKRNGFTLSEALKTAWANVKLKRAMKAGIVKFYYQKVSGEIREAYGTLKESLMPETSSLNRRRNDTVQVYYDTERQEYRSFKKANILF